MRLEILGGMGGMSDPNGRSVHLSFSLDQAARFSKDALMSVAAPLNRDIYPFAYNPLQIIPILSLSVVLGMCLWARGWKRVACDLAPFALAFAVSLLPLVGWARVCPDNQHSRFLYLPSVFSSAALGACFIFVRDCASKRCARLACLAAGIVIATWCAGLVLENRHWHRASSITRRMIDTFPASVPQAKDRIFVTGLPDNFCGAIMFRNGFHFAVELFTTHGERVLQITSPTYAITPGHRKPWIVYRWNASDEQWEEEQ
jgi:protein O-mannosyl-transferase